ncbi:siderophore ABC transporter substrate-binding protein [Gemelliphila palaticanis]|uniref:ABC transporter substrate-binding protein n=1 Tax=Gemelliphila palaticanis TaxID=81950 RepID=A0ABX2T1C7_9BACL|nr:ABC transporter substrate-binding protein [Gemella palaticanis]MBF0715512.1 ABC transporter substrate-binding protein [Gemella palaticanis]NYS47442.1 ABC transporter substrate-binding protein [Gemella palaticanis]
MNFKKIIIPFAALTLATTITACSNNNTQTSTSEKAKEGEKVKVKTSQGELEVAKNPKTVAVFDIAVLDLIQRYGVKVENLSTPKISAKYVEGLIAGKDTAGNLREPNYEFLSTVKPDVIFVNQRQKDVLEELKKVGPTASFVANNKDYFNSMIEFNTEVAKIFGVEDKVKEDKAKFEAKIKEVSEKAKASNKKVLIVMTNEGKITAFGPNSRFGYIHTLFGFKPVDENIEESTHGNEINYEYISKMNPDIIFYVDRNTVVKSKTDANAKTTLDNELIKATRAGKENAIYEIDAQYAYLAGNGLTAFEKISEVLEKAVK